MPFDLKDSPFWPADDPAVIAHMNILQGVINRLATQSGSCKTWCLTIVGALVTLAGATRSPGIVQFAIVPIIVFAYLDTMYLANEKEFRVLYNSTATAVSTGAYKRGNAFQAVPAKVSIVRAGAAFLSWSIWPVYLSLILAYLIAYFTGWIAALAQVPR